MMEFIHKSKKRMLLILDKRDITVWIDPETPKDTVNHLMKPYNETHMSAHSISKDASYASKNRNYPEIKDPVEFNETTQGDLFA